MRGDNMNTLKSRIRKLIEEVEEENQEMLVNPIDHSKAVGSEPVTDEPEVIDHATGKVVKISDRKFSMTESALRRAVRQIISRTQR